MSDFKSPYIDTDSVKEKLIKQILNSNYGRLETTKHMKKDYIVLQKLDACNDAVIATIFKSHVGAIYPHNNGVCILVDGCKVYAYDSYPDVVKQMFD